MLGAQSLHNNNPNNVTQVSCTTTTLIKYTVNKGYSHNSNNNESTEKEESNQNGLAPSSAITTATTKTTTTFNINSQTARASQSNETTSRPPFITTVKKGKFLPSKFDLLVERSLFTFSSRPRPVNLIKHHCCSGSNKKEESATSTSPPRGAHDYYNVMWDPHIVRGTTSTTTRFTDINKEKNCADPIESKISKIKRPAQLLKSNRPKYKNSLLASSPSASSPSPIVGRHNTMIQTEQYLEELLDDGSEPIQIHQAIQTEPIYDLPIYNDTQSQFVQVKHGIDISTQILPGELFNFDEEIQPILESMIGKILEQAMFETIEEEEIAALREEKNRFQEQRRKEKKELGELQLEHQRISAQKEQLRRHLENERSNMPTSMAHERVIEHKLSTGRDQESFTTRVTAGTSVYTTSYLLELLPSVLNSLRQEGFLSDNVDEDAFSSFVEPQRLASSCTNRDRDSGGGHDINSIDETHVETNYDIETMETAVEETEEEDKWPRYSNHSKELEESSSSLSSWSPTTQESQSHDTSTPTTVTTILQRLSSTDDQ